MVQDWRIVTIGHIYIYIYSIENLLIYQSINHSNFYGAKIPSKVRLSGAIDNK